MKKGQKVQLPYISNKIVRRVQIHKEIYELMYTIKSDKSIPHRRMGFFKSYLIVLLDMIVQSQKDNKNPTRF